MKLHLTQLLRHCSGVDFVGDVCVFPHWSAWRIWGRFVCHAEHSMHIMAKGICEERTCLVFARSLDMQIIEMPSYCALPYLTLFVWYAVVSRVGQFKVRNAWCPTDSPAL